MLNYSTIFFQKLAMFWLSKDNKLKDEAIRYCSKVTGYSESVILICSMFILQYMNPGDRNVYPSFF